LIAAWEEKLVRKPTPWNELGPFYKKRAPQTNSEKGKWITGHNIQACGGVVM
jgi:hypothetical protein